MVCEKILKFFSIGFFIACFLGITFAQTCVDNTALATYITQWKTDSTAFTMPQLMLKIADWKSGANCTANMPAFYVSPNGSGSHDGSLPANAFNLSQAVNYADAHTDQEIVFLLASGNYGALTLANPVNRAVGKWAAWKGINKGEAIFDKIYIAGHGKELYFKFDSIKVQQIMPVPAPPADGCRHELESGVSIHGNNIQILNSDLFGIDKYLSNGVNFTNSNNVLIENCDIKTWVSRGINAMESNNVTIRNNKIHDSSQGSPIGIGTVGHGTDYVGILIEGNEVYDMEADYADTYYPYHIIGGPDYDGGNRAVCGPVNGVGYHTGSGITVRTSNVVIRNNIFRNLHALGQALMFYADSGSTGLPYSNILVEKNVFYDNGGPIQKDDGTWQIAGYGDVRFSGCGENVTIQYNTFAGNVEYENTGRSDLDIFLRYGSPVLLTMKSGFDGNSVKFANNIVIGKAWGFYEAPKGIENYNLFWGYDQGGNFPANKGEHTVYAVWSSSGVYHGWPNLFENMDFNETKFPSVHPTPEYNYSRDGITNFFVNPNFYTNVNPNAGNLSSGKGQILDYHPVTGSPICNGGYINGVKVFEGAVPGTAWAGALPCSVQ